jgi:UDP-galactopyranose mutase
MKIHIYGCGMSGVTAAILFKEQGHDVEIFEVRDHIAGNCYDVKNDDGCTVHKYGSHIFHTNNEEVWEFLNRYTKFNSYEHRVRANTKEGLLSIPFSKKTEEQLGRDLDPKEIQDLLFREYSERHWGIPWEELPKSISGRVPNKRDDHDDRYFTDKYQGIPENGYTAMFKNMLDGIKVNLGAERGLHKRLKADLVVWTGKISEYFDLKFGHLPYRSLRFEHKRVEKDPMYTWDKGAVINECNTKPFNRTMDNSVYLNEDVTHTVHTRDFPEEYEVGKNDPIYPKTFGVGPKVYQKYLKAAIADQNTVFLGRLATYKYLDMWMAVAQVMSKIKK